MSVSCKGRESVKGKPCILWENTKVYENYTKINRMKRFCKILGKDSLGIVDNVDNSVYN